MELEIIYGGQVFLSMLLGAVLGWQRSRRGKSAGPRTFGLVTAGSTLFTLMSKYGFGSTIGTNSANIAAQIVTGIGFLGVSLIFHKEDRVEGLTTAAGLWAAAAVGMAVGLSFYVLSILSTAVIFLVLMINERMKKVYEGESEQK